MGLRTFLLAGLIALAGCVGLQPPSQIAPTYPSLPRTLVLDNIVAATMREIQSEYEIETVRCLTGYVHNDTVYVESMEPVRIIVQTNISTSFEYCRSPRTVGYYHNHPPGQDEDGNPVYYCAFSEPDVRTLNDHNNLWVGVVTCDSVHFVWYFKHDNVNYIWPPRD